MMMDMQYKVYAEQKNGKSDVWFFDDEQEAYRKYKSLQNERLLKTLWAEIWETDYDVPGSDWYRVQGFERETIETILPSGREVQAFTGRIIEFY